jgi:hypothetical protein
MHRILISLSFLLLAGCPWHSSGAFITFSVAGEEITLWIENEAFIEEAIALEGEGNVRVPNFNQVIAGAGIDADYSWHVDPHDVEWADMTIELCDATPGYIEDDPQAWIDQVGGWCPWTAEVILVETGRVYYATASGPR